jgi:hypothetical protein
MRSLEFGFPCVDGVEIAMVGAGISGGFINTNELHTIKDEDAMSSKRVTVVDQGLRGGVR